LPLRRLHAAGGGAAPVLGGGEAAQDGRDARELITGNVVAVLDGDTITVLDGQRQERRIRLAGIDAPEKAQDFGQASKQRLSDLVFRKEVEVRYSKLDRYGRVLGVVYLGGEDVNLKQVAVGMAWHYKEYASEQLPEDRERYAEAESAAREARIGLWGGPSPVKPSEFRREGRDRRGGE
jgi:Micrococcal nuclease (thermonuclease) homologs